MAFSNPFKAKNKVDATIIVGTTVPKQYKAQRFDLWAKISGDGQNVMLHAFDDNGNPKSGGTWQRSPKVIVSATDPAGSAEVQTVTLNNTPTGGTFTLSFAGQTTGGIAYNAAASVVQTAFTGLSSVGAGNAVVSGSAGGPYTVTFSGTLNYKNQPAITGNGASLTGAGAQPTVTVAETTAGVDNRTSNGVQANDLWVNTAGGSSVVKAFVANVWK